MRLVARIVAVLLLLGCQPASAAADGRCLDALDAAGRSVMRTRMEARTRRALREIASLPCDALPESLRRAARDAGAAPSFEAQRRILAEAARPFAPACAGVDPEASAEHLVGACLRDDRHAEWIDNRHMRAGPALYAHVVWRYLVAAGVVRATDGHPILLLELLKGTIYDRAEGSPPGR